MLAQVGKNYVFDAVVAYQLKINVTKWTPLIFEIVSYADKKKHIQFNFFTSVYTNVFLLGQLLKRRMDGQFFCVHFSVSNNCKQQTPHTQTHRRMDECG